MSCCQANEGGGCKAELWAENRGGVVLVVGGWGVGVCLCGIRQGLACMTRATRKFPVWWSSSPAQRRRQQCWPAGRGGR